MHLVALSTHTQNDQKLSQHIQPTTMSLIFPNSKPMIVMKHGLTNVQKCGKGMGKQNVTVCTHQSGTALCLWSVRIRE